MTEEVSVYTQLSVSICMTAILVTVAANLLVMSRHILDGYTNKYTEIAANADANEIAALTMAGEVACPVAYTTLNAGLATIDVVYVNEGGALTKIYSYDDEDYQNLIYLMTKYKNKSCIVELNIGELRQDMNTVKLKVVD